MAQTIIASDIILLVSFVLEQSIAFCRSGVVPWGDIGAMHAHDDG